MFQLVITFDLSSALTAFFVGMYDFDTCNPGLGFLNSHEHQKNQKINKCALENPCETMARREQV